VRARVLSCGVRKRNASARKRTAVSEPVA
jgi:hypothetical protein